MLRLYPNLKEFDLSEVNNCVGDEVFYAIKEMIQLTSLNLKWCRKITDEAIEEFSAGHLSDVSMAE